MSIVITVRCFMYTLLITFPCYVSMVTKCEVFDLCTIINDFLNTKKSDKAVRRKIKALHQLSRTNEFTYVLCGVINLEMTLPLSYTSLCTTYLIIILQVSKFID
ncbi:uncharacterized protein LOC133320805 [Danaus plexippus]|uniref:uncharacterized protein LOC133320805 n=1 Tax=Danaus plexippus TaxID=13037 RepID=UPI002AB1DEDB|nr:uncharacterized protein LOC133320805 [Danaus plexippus]